MRIAAAVILLTLSCMELCKAAGDAYSEAGVPSVATEWSIPVYNLVAAKIRAGTAPLPRLSDPEGARVFKKLNDVSIFDQLKGDKGSIDERVKNYLQIYTAQLHFAALYEEALSRGDDEAYNELVECVAFSMRGAEVGISLVNEKDTSSHETGGMSEWKQTLHKDMREMFAAYEGKLSQGMSTRNKVVILTAMRDVLPAFNQAFTADFRAEMSRKFKDRSGDFEGQDKELLQWIIRFLDEN